MKIIISTIIILLFTANIITPQILRKIDNNAGIVSEIKINSERESGYIDYSRNSDNIYLKSSSDINSVSFQKSNSDMKISNYPYGTYPYKVWLNGVDPQNYYNYIARQNGLLPPASDKPNGIPKYHIQYIKVK